MKSPRFVCPYDRRLFRVLNGHAVAARVGDAAEIKDAAAAVRESGNVLFCVIVQSDRPLSEIELRDDHRDIPIALMAPAMGSFRSVAKRIDLLRRLNLRVYLPCNAADNLSALRILASLGIHGCVTFVTGPKDWDALADLMTYAVLGRAPHASREPFSYIAANYDRHASVDWRLIEFDDARRFLHLDQSGRIALSADELRRGVFAAQSVGDVSTPALIKAIDDRANIWREYFVDNHPCAACAGWRACLGRFAAERAGAPGCVSLFTELIEAGGVFKASTGNRHAVQIWQP